MAESIIASYDNTNGMDNSVLIVGKKKPGDAVEIINAFQGKEADELWRKLTVRKAE
jgi:hypothetical protein